MSISDLFDSGFKKRNEDHFAAIVRVAMDDGVISDEEKAFLDRLARNLDISEDDYKLILLRKIGIGLGFSPDNVKYVVDKALTLVSNGVDLDTFIEEIRNMNR